MSPRPNAARLPAGVYPAIGDYAVIGDCRTAALVSKDGAVEWLCLPSFESPSVFASILDREKGGYLGVRPEGARRVERRYIEDTNVLETRFITPTGILRVLDLMPIIVGPEGDAELHATREILRVVECVQGEVTVCVHYRPRPDYARQEPKMVRRGKLGWTCEYGADVFYLRTDIPVEEVGPGMVEGSETLKARDRRHVSLSHAYGTVGIIPPLGKDADLRLDLTVRWWRDWAAHLKYEGPHRKAVRRSALTLKLFSYAPTGALVGAPTLGLPERPGGGLNWDYRYCWPRDAGLTIRTFGAVGLWGEARAFLGWLLHATRGTQPRILPLYDLYGRPPPVERELPHLEGYRKSQPVRTGNGARGQVQLDVYGSLILAASDYVERGGSLGPAEQHLIRRLGDHVCQYWRQPDNGIWEFRSGRRHNTFSKVMCWVALDRLLRLHSAHSLRLDARRIANERDVIHDEIEARGWNNDVKAYVGELGGDWADAALLLMPRVGYIDANHPRMTSTLRFIERRLGENGLIHRYSESAEPGYGREGAFGICCFWYVDCLARRGELERARQVYDRLIRASNDVGLFAEEIDAETLEGLGNFPQALTHIGVILGAQTIREVEHEMGGRDLPKAASWR